MAERDNEPVVESTYLIHEPLYGQGILATLNKYRISGTFTDAIITIEHEEFPCHRGVLAASSPYFMALFSSDLKEGKEARVVFKDMSAWTVKRLIEYAYSGSLEITVNNAQEILAAANLLEFPVVVDACCRFLETQLHPTNCLGIEKFAQLHSCDHLAKIAHKQALENFSSVVESDEFLNLSVDILSHYISSDHIDVRYEETVYEAVIKWIKSDIDIRVKYLPELLQHVRLPTVDLKYLEDIVEKDSLIQSSVECRAFVQDAKLYHETKTDQSGKRRLSMQKTTLPRPSTVAKECIVIVGGIDVYIQTSVEMYEPHKDKWSKLPDLPEMVSWYSVSSLHNNVYVLGGIVNGRIVPTAWKFDSAKRLWSKIMPMITARAKHVSTSMDNKIFVLGGIKADDTTDVEEIECYDYATKQWSLVGRSPSPRKQSCIVPYNQTLIEVGGTVGSKTTESYVYNGKTLVYSGEQFVLSESIQFAKIVVLNSVFFIIWEDSKQVIAMDPVKRTFRRLADMNYSHVHSGICVIDNRIYITGGLMDSKPSQVIEVYDSELDTWTVVKSMYLARACHGCVSIQM
ncbi:unnamed protein product [Owenia fusiformis]|uniref:Uncharacterized protein n=1 Tax=Owenia fusiformis TaxID=6347 RepID=A0A8J1UDL5_OWEFU|nr:unnamed protein product [Owenia fusiformis]